MAIDGLPVTVLCHYRRDGPELPRLHATHLLLFTGGGPEPSLGYRLPHEAVVEYPPPPPPDLGSPDAELDFDAAGLSPLRHRVAGAAGAVGLDADRVADMVLAVNEIAANIIEHGPGRGRLRLWISDHQLAAEVADSGRMDIPFPAWWRRHRRGLVAEGCGWRPSCATCRRCGVTGTAERRSRSGG